MDSNFIPKRKFIGPLFLSRYNLWVDWRKNRKLNMAFDDIVFNLEGNKSVLEIANELDIPYAELHAWLNKLHKIGLIEKLTFE